MKNLIKQRLADAVSMDIPEIVEREFRLPNIPNKTHAVIGMRRTGKTYFLFQKIKQYLSEEIDQSRLVYFNFEDERLAEMTSKELHWITDEYYVLYPENMSRKVYFFFDEIQMVKGWEVFTRRLMDNENVQIFISGSSAKLLSREIASSMRGRSIETIIYPYSYREFLKIQGIDYPSSPARANKQQRNHLANRFLKYLLEGGFPEAQGLENRDRHLLLQGYVNMVLFRDIIDRFNISNTMVLKKLIRHLISNAGTHFTVNKFFNYLKSQGMKVAKTTLYEYLDHIQDAFLLFPVHIYTDSERKRMLNPIKPYIIDTGLTSAFSTKQEPDSGKLLENNVFVELKRRQAEISYMRTSSGYEVDFIARYPDGRVQAIQVSADVSNPQTLERECRSLREICSLLPEAELILVNLSEESEIKVINKRYIVVLPAWKWMLSGF